MHATTRPTEAPNSQARRWLWPAIVLGFIGLQGTMSGVLIFFAVNDSTFAVEPDYYRKALQWDRTVAERRDSVASGWKADVRIARIHPVLRQHRVRCELRDAEGAPIDGAAVQATALHHAHGGVHHEWALRETQAGRYEFITELPHDGYWELRIRAEARGQTFVANELVYVDESVQR